MLGKGWLHFNAGELPPALGATNHRPVASLAIWPQLTHAGRQRQRNKPRPLVFRFQRKLAYKLTTSSMWCCVSLIAFSPPSGLKSRLLPLSQPGSHRAQTSSRVKSPDHFIRLSSAPSIRRPRQSKSQSSQCFECHRAPVARFMSSLVACRPRGGPMVKVLPSGCCNCPRQKYFRGRFLSGGCFFAQGSAPGQGLPVLPRLATSKLPANTRQGRSCHGPTNSSRTC